MPINKKDNKKNAPVEKRNAVKVPRKEDSGKTKPIQKTKSKISSARVNALTTAGKKKKSNSSIAKASVKKKDKTMC